MKHILPLLALSGLAFFATPSFAHDTPGVAHDHEYEAFFFVDDHYEHVYSSMPEINPSDYFVDFSELDANGNGYITRTEVSSYSGCGCTAKAQANLLREFHVADVNRDNRLSASEMGDWLVMDAQ